MRASPGKPGAPGEAVAHYAFALSWHRKNNIIMMALSDTLSWDHKYSEDYHGQRRTYSAE